MRVVTAYVQQLRTHAGEDVTTRCGTPEPPSENGSDSRDEIISHQSTQYTTSTTALMTTKERLAVAGPFRLQRFPFLHPVTFHESLNSDALLLMELLIPVS